MIPGRRIDDFVMVREDPEYERRFHFSDASGLGAEVDYQVKGSAAHDRPFLAVVVGVGPGKERGPDGTLWLDELRHLLSERAYEQACSQFGRHDDRPAVVEGDTILTNLNALSYRVPARPGYYLLRGDMIMAIIDRETHWAGPVNHWVRVKRPEEARLMRAISRGGIYLPTGDMATDDTGVRHGSGIVAAYGEVEACGPGRWEEGRWTAPSCRPGEIVLYDASWGSLPVTVKGEKRVMVASTQIIDVVDESLLVLNP